MQRRRPQTAKLIWDDLKAHGPSTKYQVQARTGLTHMQFWYGMGYLRDVMQRQLGDPIVWSPRRGVYDLTTTSRAAVTEWLEDWRLPSVRTQLSRMVETCEADVLKFGPSRERTLHLAALKAAYSLVDALMP